jgi:rhamnosyltransferase
MKAYAIPATPDIFKELLKTQDDELIDSVVRSINPYILNKNAGLTRILSTTDRANNVQTKLKVALLVHSYYPDSVPDLLKYASNMPEDADIYFTTGSDRGAQEIQKQFDELDIKCGKFEVHVIGNKSSDAGVLLLDLIHLLDKYDLFCYAHDQNSSYMSLKSFDQDYNSMLFECNLASKEYVHNIISEFEANKHLGLTFPPLAHYANRFPFLCGKYSWNKQHNSTRLLLRSLDVKNNLPGEFIPLFAPVGSVFWARTNAVRNIFDNSWKYKSLPSSRILRAIDYIWAYLAAEAGYYSMLTLSENYFSADFGVYADYLHGTISTCFQNGIAFGSLEVVAKSLGGLK